MKRGPISAPARWGAVGALSAGLAVMTGAFGAHALRGRLTPEQLDFFETATRYLMFHALALFAAAWALERRSHAALTWAAWLFLAGTVLFCASLYALALTGVPSFATLIPVGGLCLIAGWFALAWGLWRGRHA